LVSGVTIKGSRPESFKYFVSDIYLFENRFNYD
jgi:hypothetical protein